MREARQLKRRIHLHRRLRWKPRAGPGQLEVLFMDMPGFRGSPHDSGSSSGMHRRILSDASRYWESHRIVYNLILAAVVVAWVILTWPHFQVALTLQSLSKLLILAAVANLCYCAAYLVDIPMQYSSFRVPWRRWRWGIWLAGTIFAFLVANYWIADEIYPFVNGAA